MGKEHAHILEKDRVHTSFGSIKLPSDARALANWASELPVWQAPAILLLDLDAFFASVEQLDHPEWKGKPVIVGGSPERRGIVSTCSYEARTFGVHSAMPSSQAARLCPEAIWTEGHFSRYRELSSKVMSILYDESPKLMQVSIDEAFLDISPTRINRSHPVLIAKRIQEKVDELGISCSIGLGTSKSVAKIASNMEKPHGVTVVWPGSEAAFFKPLPVGEMSGIGLVAQRRLQDFGIRKLGELACADDDVLRSVFGKNAQTMKNRLLGVDSAVNPDNEPAKSISNEISVSESVSTRRDVEALMTTMAHKVGRRLRRTGRTGTTLHLKLRYENLKIRTCQRQVPELGTNELAWLPILGEMLDELWHEGVSLRLVGVGVSGFDAQLPSQETLFNLPQDPSTEHAESEISPNLKARAPEAGKLLQASDAIAAKFGENALRFGHEIRSYGNTTGSSAKNPADYKN